MLIENLEKKTRLALITVLMTVIGSVTICIANFVYCHKLITDDRKQIYVLDGDIPFLAKRSEQEINFEIEAKAHIQMFHQLFFNLAPDDEYIKWTTKKAMYLVDNSGLKQKQAMEEQGFYSDLLASSAVMAIVCDSIIIDKHTMSFKYYGKQIIKRRTKSLRRSILTAGYLETVPRTQNNPHGLLITKWRTLENKDLQDNTPLEEKADSVEN